MKSRIFIISLLFLLSCGQNSPSNRPKIDQDNIETNNVDFPGLRVRKFADSLFVYYPKAKISSDRILQREHGKKIVFHYYYSSTDYIDVFDEEYYEEIQFEIQPNPNQVDYSTNIPAEFNTVFNWGCYCDWPDSLEAKQNEGEIMVYKTSDSTWHVKFEITNTAIGKKKKIEKDFKIYKPIYELARRDTLNLTDSLGRKQGHWITEDYFTIKNGIYQDNRFTGSEYLFMYYKERKTLSAIWEYENGKWTKSEKFDRFGKRKE